MNSLKSLEAPKLSLPAKIKKWFADLYSTDRTKKYISIGLLGLFGVVVISGLIIMLVFQNSLPTIKNSQGVLASKPGQMVTSTLVTGNNELPSSMILAPATAEWWDNLSPYITNSATKALDYSLLSPGAKYLTLSTTTGGNFAMFSMLGLPAVLIIYENEEAATTAMNSIPQSGQAVGVKGNLLILAPEGAGPSDFNLIPDDITNSDTLISEDDLPMDNKAVLYLNSESIKETLVKGFGISQSGEFLEGFFELLGITNMTSWYGTSTDGETWEGTFTNFRANPNLDLETVVSYVANSTTIILEDGTTIPYRDATPEQIAQSVNMGTLAYFLRHVNIATKTQSAGQVTANASAGTFQWVPRLQDNSIMRVVMNPNDLVSILRGDVDVAYNSTGLDYVDILIHDVSGRSTIKIGAYDAINPNLGTNFEAEPWVEDPELDNLGESDEESAENISEPSGTITPGPGPRR